MKIPLPSSRMLATFCLLLCLPSMTVSRAQVVTQDDFTQAKSSFDDMLHKAAESSQRKAQLESDLALYQSTVKQVQDALDKTNAERKQVRSDIAQRKDMYTALEKQVQSIRSTKDFYSGILKEQKADLVTFVRYVATRQMEVADTGPVVGGDLLRQMLRGSLGDLIEQDLSRQALLSARQQFLTELSLFMTENDSALTRLQSMEAQLQTEMASLQATYESLQQKSDEAQVAVDNSWKQKTLTEQELQQVQDETNDVNSELAAMQSSLLAIHTELKQAKLQQLASDMADLLKQKKDLTVQKESLEAKEDRLNSINNDQLKAFNDAMQKVNTDKNQYKRVAELQLKITQKEEQYTQKSIVAASFTGSLADAAAMKDIATKNAELEGLMTELNRMKDTLGLLQKGVPLDSAEEYVRKKQLWIIAQDQLKQAQADLDGVNADLATLESKITDTQNATDAAKNDSFDLQTLGGSTTGFFWPVHGPITAGYYDEAYQKVFHVPHRAIDIAVPQSTPVHSTADGIVFHVKLGGAKGFTYVLIGHQNGYASLYGHLSHVMVKEGDIIVAGQIIGLSGGTPGTDGAGPMTTGAHLHFEMTKNGVHFDPRTVLPAK